MKVTPKLFLLVFFSVCASQVFADMVLSQFQRATYSDLLIDNSGMYHAVFLESPAIGKPRFVYYTFSSNGGALMEQTRRNLERRDRQRERGAAIDFRCAG